uniref:OSJNBa0021F22.23 protein n=1 Tax=Oryza sativa subsp. japonica TaxID=39947 RepID=Q7XP77_ORYSJ|nr:OSJNBa0085C10.7 [Oryza sativa Japonica Group]CAE03729.2 OSJNBa0021F22.23 [Oryza sativa Japonica Group]
MPNKTLCEFAAPSTDNVAIGPQVNIGDVDFDLKSSLITMAQASPFCGKPNEDANAHLQQFLEICSTYTIKGVSPDAVRLRLFPFSLLGRAKQWFYANRVAINTWDKCSTTFLSKFFPMGKTKALRGRISSFQQTRDESIPEAWERLHEYVAACPHHGMDDWLIPQNFYNGLTPMSRDHMDAAAGGAFFSKTVQGAIDLIEKMETELLAAKLDLLMKQLDDHEKRPQGTVKALDSHATCEVCGNTGHFGNDCPESREEAMYMGNNNNRYRPQGGQGWNKPCPYYQGGNNNGNNQSSLKDLVFAQAKTTYALSKKLAANDKKIHINVPLLDTMQVPTYACYLKDILNNKRPLPTTEVVKLTEQCSNVILHKLPEKKKDPGCPTITCSIGAQQFDQALCDLGASVSVMPKDVFDKLYFTVLAPTPMRLQLADSSVRYLAGIAEDVPVKIRDFFIPGSQFLSTAGDNIDVGTGSIHFHINGKEEKFEFQLSTE